MKFFLRSLLLAVLFANPLLITPLLAQQKLTAGRTSGYYTFIYKLTDKETYEIAKKPGQELNKSYFHTVIDSFYNDYNKRYQKKLPYGSYLYLHADKNELTYWVEQVQNVTLQSIDNGSGFQFIIKDLQGQLVSNATVTQGKDSKVPYDAKSHVYKASEKSKLPIIKVNYNGVTNYFSYNKNKAPKPKRTASNKLPKSGSKASDRTYKGYLLFNKPVYRPHDTVKFKAYLLTNKGKAIHNEVLRLVLKKSTDESTIISMLKPYREGGYEGSFVLVDSMMLKLDTDYDLELKRKIKKEWVTVFSKAFKYEDYELESSRFFFRSNKDVHSSGSPIVLYLKATDENDLAVPDGRAEIQVTSKQSWNQEIDKSLFYKDTLWTHTVRMDPVGETKVVLPDSIFPKINVSFNVNITFRSSNNEVKKVMKSYKYLYNEKKLQLQLIGDSILVDLQENEASLKTKGKLFFYTSYNHILDSMEVKLPAKLKADPRVYSYEVLLEDGSSFDEETDRLSPNFFLHANLIKDSLNMRIGNEQKLPFWYIVFADNRVFKEGYSAHEIDTAMLFPSSKSAHVKVRYIWAGKVPNMETDAFYNTQELNVALSAPKSVQPGQTVTMEVKVTDVKKDPVAATDVTAMAYTSKFQSDQDINLYAFGSSYTSLKLKPLPNNLRVINLAGALKLDWLRWSKDLGLDTIAYYQFMHPGEVYVNEESINDSMAVVVPFAIKDGDIEPSHIVYIDDIPVYYSKAEQLKRYAFRIAPGRHKITLVTAGHVVEYEQDFNKEKKTILGIKSSLDNAKAKVSEITLAQMGRRQAGLQKYLVYINDNFGGDKTILTTGQQDYLVNPPPYQVSRNKPLLLGPFNGDKLRFSSGPIDLTFNKKDGVLYTLIPGKVQQNEFPSINPAPELTMQDETKDFKQNPVLKKEIDSLWEDYLNQRSKNTRPGYNSKSNPSTGNLRMSIDTSIKNHLPDLKNIIIYKKDDPGFILTYNGFYPDFKPLIAGQYRFMFLFMDNSYFIEDNVEIRPRGTNLFLWKNSKVKPADEMSRKVDEMIKTSLDKKQRLKSNIVHAFQPETLRPSWDKNIKLTRIKGKVVDAATGETLRYASIFFSTTTKRPLKDVGQTNATGLFDIAVPRKGVLKIVCVGYKPINIKIKPDDILLVKMHEESGNMAEVVIRGYSKGAVSGMNIQDISNAPGMRRSFNIRGLGSLNFNRNILIVLDGKPFKGKLEDIDPDDIFEVVMLDYTEGITTYGSAGANGVLVVTTRNGTGSDQELAAKQYTLRNNFSDYAIWQPRLLTDKEGKASFTVKFPDDITSWATKILAVNGHGQSGYQQTLIKSFKTLSANFTSPQFALAGDIMNVIGKLMNYNNTDEQAIRKFVYNDQELLNSNVSFKNAHIDTIAIAAPHNPATADSLKFQYTMQQENGYFDGELRKIPILPVGTVETKGYFDVLPGDTTVNYNFDPAMGKVTLRAESSVFPVLLDEMEKLRSYEYMCNEQLASKLMGLLLEKSLRKYLGEEFNGEKNIKDLIKKLQAGKRPEGTWGWWQDSNEEMWISLHAVEALLMAQKQGYTVALDKDFMQNYLAGKLAHQKPADPLNLIRILNKLDEKYNAKDWITTFEQQKLALGTAYKQPLYEKLQLMQLKQQAGIPVDLNWLLMQKKSTMFGNIYWGETNMSFWDNSIQNTLLAYQILKTKGGYKNELDRIMQYFLEQRKDGQWRNTYESSLILETILPDLMLGGRKPVSASLVLNETEKINSFPFSKRIQPGKIKVEKKGDGRVYFTAYQQFDNPKPEKVIKDFTVSSTLKQKGSNVLKGSLKSGVSAVLQVDVDVHADADYVMIEIPIPAGCSYENKTQNYGGVETHRAYFKDKTSIFCSKLKQGRYTFTVQLMPRYSGRYNLNPAKAEMMYFPVFYGREGIKKIVIN